MGRDGCCAAACDCSYYQKRLRSRCYSFGQRRVRRFVRQILVAGEESYERPALPGNVIAESAGQHWVARFQCIQDRTLRYRTWDLQFHLAAHTGQGPQMGRENDPDHDRV
jgi:hypothetical protein